MSRKKFGQSSGLSGVSCRMEKEDPVTEDGSEAFAHCFWALTITENVGLETIEVDLLK